MSRTSEESTRKELKYNIIEHVADLCEPDKNGWIIQLNVMTWGRYKNPVIDIRKWQYTDDGEVTAGKGITLSSLECLSALQKINIKNLERYFQKDEEVTE